MGKSAKQIGWKEAIILVLEEEGEGMRYGDIAQVIMERELVATKTATPNIMVHGYLRENDEFVRVAPAVFTLRDMTVKADSPESEEKPQPEIVRAFGMFWNRGKVEWTSNPKIFGQQSPNAELVNFSDQRGIYLLHDRREVIYVGRSIDMGLGPRLNSHTQGRLGGRWDRFSWFGSRDVTNDGQLTEVEESVISIQTGIRTLEAVLIESLEPPQNRRMGDGFQPIEYNQVLDPKWTKMQEKRILASILKDYD